MVTRSRFRLIQVFCHFVITDRFYRIRFLFSRGWKNQINDRTLRSNFSMRLEEL
jgi:hypothetical protein